MANCGAIAGGISAAITTPLDVVKTRIMLADKKDFDAKTLRALPMAKLVYKEGGFKGFVYYLFLNLLFFSRLFAGFTPRVVWITLGGYIFFGMYDLSKNFCEDLFFDARDIRL